MRVLRTEKLEEYKKEHAEVRGQLDAWLADISRAKWTMPLHVQQDYGNDVVVKNRAIFNIKGNKYRIVVNINYGLQIVDIRFIGTHDEYNKIDALTI